MRRGASRTVLAVALVASALIAAPTTAEAHRSAPARTEVAGKASVAFGARTISVPSGDQFYGSDFVLASANAGHVVVYSGSDLTAPPASDGSNGNGGLFDLTAGRIVRLDCGCTFASWISNDGVCHTSVPRRRPRSTSEA